MTQIADKPAQMGLTSQILFILCSVLIIDTLTAAAALGTGVIGWWLVTLLFFVIPYALISAELGTSYPSEGGIYSWVKQAFGLKMAARTTWLYWVNVGLWMPAVYIMFAGMLAELFFPELTLGWRVAICIVLIWLTIYFCNVSVDVGVWVSKVGALLKMAVIMTLGCAGFIYAIQHGMANQLTLHSMLPSLDGGVEFLPAIIYNLLGLELIVCLGKSIKAPARNIPRAMLGASIIIAALYLFGTLGILAALPAEKIGLIAGLIDAARTLFTNLPWANELVTLLGICILLTFISNMVNWTMGSSRAAAEAAEAGELPAFVAWRHARHGSPLGANICTGIIATLVIIAYAVLARTNDELFWSVFAFSSTIFLLPYLLLFASFLRLRYKDPATPRLFRVKGNRLLIIMQAAIGMLFIFSALLLFIFPQLIALTIDWHKSAPLLAGLLITLLLGEIIVRHTLSRQSMPEQLATE